MSAIRLVPFSTPRPQRTSWARRSISDKARQITVRQLAELCLKAAHCRAKIVSVNERKRPAKSEVELLLCNAARAKRLLGWEPEVSLEEGLGHTAEYVRQNLGDYCVNGYSV